MKEMIIITLLLLPIAMAMSGGEEYNKHFSQCFTEVKANITATQPIDPNEYVVTSQNCTEQSKNYYVCNCTNNQYDFNITFHERAQNNYTIKYEYDYQEEQAEITPSSSGGGSGGGGSSTMGTLKPNTEKKLVMIPNKITRFTMNNVHHSMKVLTLTSTTAMIEIRSKPLIISLSVGETKKVNLDGDCDEDIQLTLTSIRGNTANINFKTLEEKDCTPKTEQKVTEPIKSRDETVPEQIRKEEENKPSAEVTKTRNNKVVGVLITSIVVLIGLLLYALIMYKRKEEK